MSLIFKKSKNSYFTAGNFSQEITLSSVAIGFSLYLLIMTNKKKTRLSVYTIVLTAIASTGLILTPSVASAETLSPDCSKFTTSVYKTVNPKSEATLLTLSANESKNSQTKYGFTEDYGAYFKTQLTNLKDMSWAHRLYSSKFNDFMWVTNEADLNAAVQKGYVKAENASFPVATKPTSTCNVPVYSLLKNNKHAYAYGNDIAILESRGWAKDKVVFYQYGQVNNDPEFDPTNPEFTIASIPDTQVESLSATNQLFQDRIKWLNDNKKEINLAYTSQVGDTTNWGWLAPQQFKPIKEGINVLEANNMMYGFARGNHDTAAVGHDGIPGSRGYGGSAYVNNPECKEKLGPVACDTTKLVRNTVAANQNFPTDGLKGLKGKYDGDNFYQTFTAGNKKWMMITLEVWQRPQVIEWANKVVKDNPDHNVIIQTHAYLNGNGTIQQNNGGYGSQSPQYLYDNLVKKYSNIKMVLSGHVGTANYRVDTGQNGNKIVSYVHNGFNTQDNPTRLIKINTQTNTITTSIYGERSNTTYTQYSTSDSGFTFVN